MKGTTDLRHTGARGMHDSRTDVRKSWCDSRSKEGDFGSKAPGRTEPEEREERRPSRASETAREAEEERKDSAALFTAALVTVVQTGRRLGLEWKNRAIRVAPQWSVKVLRRA